MKKKIFLSLIISFLFIVPNVNAENSVDYTLTITEDYKFKEEIKYTITDYEEVEDGENYFAEIVSDDIYVDILYKTKYKKTKKFENNTYYVTLSHTHSEYTFSNSIFLNNCFQNSNYEYDIDKYSFKGNGGFNCLNGDSLKIKLITNLEATDTNATVSGNEYTWIPTSNDLLWISK